MTGEPALDFLVVGGGPGGYAAALHAAHLRRRVTLADRRGHEGLGGVCLHEGCIPTKALLHLAERAADFDRFSGAGLRATDVTVDFKAFQVWKAGLIARLSDGVRRLLAAAKVEVVAADVRLTGPASARLEAADGTVREVSFVDAVLAGGSRPVSPPGLPIDGRRVLDSTVALELEVLPSSIVVVGGGSVGMELGAAFAKLGAQLTVVEQAAQILPLIDPVLVRPLRRRLGQLGVAVHTSAAVADLDDGHALIRTADGEVRVEAERVLAGVGRRPNTATLGLEAAGITIDDEGFVHPAADRRVAPHIAAVGDLTPGPFHAHKASAEARVAAEVLCGRPAAFDARLHCRSSRTPTRRSPASA